MHHNRQVARGLGGLGGPSGRLPHTATGKSGGVPKVIGCKSVREMRLLLRGTSVNRVWEEKDKRDVWLKVFGVCRKPLIVLVAGVGFEPTASGL